MDAEKVCLHGRRLICTSFFRGYVSIFSCTGDLLIYRVAPNEWPPHYKSVEIWFFCEQKPKISKRGWRPWKNWIFIILPFLAGVTFRSIIFEKNDQKMTQAKKFASKKSALSYNSTTQDFLKSMFYLQTFLLVLCHSSDLLFLRQNVKERHQSPQNY